MHPVEERPRSRIGLAEQAGDVSGVKMKNELRDLPTAIIKHCERHFGKIALKPTAFTVFPRTQWPV
jgi:hypothetical protein